MPHTQRKNKPARSKRQQITDDDGWTRVTSSIPRADRGNQVMNGVDTDVVASESSVGFKYRDLQVAQAPADVTVGQLMARFNRLERLWQTSGSYRTLEKEMETQVVASRIKITNCVLFGTGSYSGFTQGWIDRHDIAFVQTAVFKTMVDMIEKFQHERPLCYAQELRYNDLDTSFLSALQIVRVDDPAAFELVCKTSLVYLPGAELSVLKHNLLRHPAVVLSTKLDLYRRNDNGLTYTDRPPNKPELQPPKQLEQGQGEYAQEVLTLAKPEKERYGEAWEEFVLDHHEVRIPDLDMKDYPLFNAHLYWSK